MVDLDQLPATRTVLLDLRREPLANARGDQERGRRSGFGHDQREFVTTVTRGSIHRARMHTQYVGQSPQSAASLQMSEAIVDAIQSIKIEQKHRKFAPGAAGALDF